jgi:hypothetical protein
VPRRCSGGRCHLVIHWFIATNRRPLPHPCASHCPALCRFSLHRFPATQALGYYGARIKKPQPPYLGCGSCPRQWPPRLPAHYRPWRRRRFRKLRPAYIRPVIASACRGRYVSHVAEGHPSFVVNVGDRPPPLSWLAEFSVPKPVKCPACADKKQQERLGQVSLDNRGEPPPALYRCCACGYLYTVPKLEDYKPADGPC